MPMGNRVNIRLLIAGALMNDPKCLRKLFMDNYGLVLKIASRYMRTKEQAEEAANDVFIKIFSNLSQYDLDRPFDFWIKKITINHCIDVLRGMKHQILTEDLAKDQIVYEEENFSEAIDNIEMLPIIKSLPPQYRMVFNLYVIEEYKHSEIADLLKISIGSSKSNLSKAKKLVMKSILQNPEFSNLKRQCL